MLEKVKEMINENYNKSPEHFERTLYWLLQLKPGADEAMQIAAYAHDIERVFEGGKSIDFWKSHKVDNKDYLKEHQEKGAKLIGEFLRKKDYPEDKIKRVEEMVRLHEVGGTPEADLIKDADSISYFEINALKHIRKFGIPLGKDFVKSKYKFMYERITSEKAKHIAKPMYEKALKKLENF